MNKKNVKLNKNDYNFILDSMCNGLYNQAINKYRYMSKANQYKFYLHCKKNSLHTNYFNTILKYL